ncbi:MAG: DUF1573 domain-containing protein [Myxococcota bacterium]
MLCIALGAGGSTACAQGVRLRIEPRSIDFGERGHQERPTTELTVRNVGDAPLTIEKIDVSCDCIRVSPRSVRAIPPGGSTKFQVSMGSGRAMGTLSKKITLTTDDPGAPRVFIPVRMRVLAAFRMKPLELRFTGSRGREPVEQFVDIMHRDPRAGGDFDFKIVDIAGRFDRPGKAFFRTKIQPLSDPAGRTIGKRITLILDPAHPEGRISAELKALLDGRNFVVPVVGEMFEGVLVKPRFVNFSRANVQDASTLVREVRLTSIDDKPFTIKSVTQKPSRPGQPGVKLVFMVFPAPSKLAHRVLIRLVPDAKESRKTSFYGKIEVETDHPTKKAITLSYTGFFTR